MSVLQMPSMTEEQVDSFRNLLADVAKDAPAVGKTCTVYRGKNKGKTGIITWHGRDKFNNFSRYESNVLQSAMRHAGGVYGFRVRVQFDDGVSAFMSAENVVKPKNA